MPFLAPDPTPDPTQHIILPALQNLTLKIDAECSSKSLADIQKITRCNNPEDHYINLHFHENLKPYT
jgi:hypothetical protein